MDPIQKPNKQIRRLKEPNWTRLFRRHLSVPIMPLDRSVERVSGLSFIFLTLTMIYGRSHGIYSETLLINNFFWAWMLMILGFCQLFYSRTSQRITFNFIASITWTAVSLTAYNQLQGWNVITAIALPHALFSFYVYSFLGYSRVFQRRLIGRLKEPNKTYKEALRAEKGGYD